MAILEKHPPHVRKRIAFFWTITVAVILVLVLIFVYTGKKEEENGASGESRFSDFYKTISDTTQSFFGEK